MTPGPTDLMSGAQTTRSSKMLKGVTRRKNVPTTTAKVERTLLIAIILPELPLNLLADVWSSSYDSN